MFIYPVVNSAEGFTSYIPVLLLTVSKRKSLGHILWGLGTIIMRRKKTNQTTTTTTKNFNQDRFA